MKGPSRRPAGRPGTLRWLLLGLLGAILLPAAAQAWGPTGHMITAQIAYDRLQPETRAEVDRLIAVLADEEPKIGHFVPASYWMDELRRLGWRAFDFWHFTNPPYNPEGLASVPASHRHDVVWAIGQAVSTLQNPRVPDPQKAWMLRVLEHLVGDVHQPLHCINRYTRRLPSGDRGGNLFELKMERNGDAGFVPDNLHAYWDGTAGLFPRIPPGAPWREPVRVFARQVREEVSPPPGIARDLDPEVWAQEGYRLAVEEAYRGIEEGGRPSEAYRRRAQSTIRRQLALGGYRLAAILEHALGSGGARQPR